ALDPDPDEGLAVGPARRLRGPQLPFRHPGARHGVDPQRARRGGRLHSLRLLVPGLHRLRPARDPALGAHEAAGPVGVHSRQRVPGRGRPHPPADRAPYRAAGHPEPPGGAARRLDEAGRPARVVSMPAPQFFLRQGRAWREAVLPPRGRRVSLEAGATDYWHRIVGPEGLAIGIDGYGESAPYAQLQEHFGFTPEKVAARVLEWA